VKTRGWLVKHARYYWLQLVDGQITRRLFGAMVRLLTIYDCERLLYAHCIFFLTGPTI
jgi:hypothetical protein